VKDEVSNPNKGTWRCFDTCVDDSFLSEVLNSQDGEFVLENLPGFADLDVPDKQKVTGRFAAAAANKDEVDAVNKQARAEAKAQEKTAAAAKAAKKAEQLQARKLAAKAARKGHLTVSTAGGSSLVPCTQCGEHISKNFASMHTCKQQPVAAMSFFGAAAKNTKSAELAKVAAAEATKAAAAEAAAAEKAAAKAEAKKRKDPNAPKRGLSAYMFFTASIRAEVTAANPDLKMTELSVKMGEQWKTLTEEEKAPFVAQAVADKARYMQEMETYNAPELQVWASLFSDPQCFDW
jgi:hypothetical protein